MPTPRNAVSRRGAKPAPGKTGQRRITPEERSRDFVQKAVELFSEVGFEGGTRELAQRLGVTQPLLYRYFPSKDDLIHAVYQKIYIDRWDRGWDAILSDQEVPLRERLQSFYESYTDVVFAREWLRVYLFAGLRGVEINRRYIRRVDDLILKRIAAGLRHQFGLPTDLPVSAEEIELFWILHGGIFYYGVRRYIYECEVFEDKSQMIANALETFLAGCEPVLRRLSGRGRGARRPRAPSRRAAAGAAADRGVMADAVGAADGDT
jgi:AcrR family transcriptional regulator